MRAIMIALTITMMTTTTMTIMTTAIMLLDLSTITNDSSNMIRVPKIMTRAMNNLTVMSNLDPIIPIDSDFTEPINLMNPSDPMTMKEMNLIVTTIMMMMMMTAGDSDGVEGTIGTANDGNSNDAGDRGNKGGADGDGAGGSKGSEGSGNGGGGKGGGSGDNPAMTRAGGRYLTGLQPLAWLSPSPLGALRDQLLGARSNSRARRFETEMLILIGKAITKRSISDGHGLNGQSST